MLEVKSYIFIYFIAWVGKEIILDLQPNIPISILGNVLPSPYYKCFIFY